MTIKMNRVRTGPGDGFLGYVYELPRTEEDRYYFILKSLTGFYLCSSCDEG